MAFDWSSLSPQACATYICVGRRYGSESALAQANQTLQALGVYGPQLVEHGFGPADVQRLVDARDELQAAGAGRDGDARARKDARRAHGDALQSGLAERQRARALLIAAARDLGEIGGHEAGAAVISIGSALEQTVRSPRRSAERLVLQLDALEAALVLAPVAAVTAGRGGPAALAALDQARAALRAAQRERPGTRGTPESTERLDLLEGVVVTLARQARRAARGAARRLGRSALLKEFALSHLNPGQPAQAPEQGAPPAIAATSAEGEAPLAGGPAGQPYSAGTPADMPRAPGPNSACTQADTPRAPGPNSAGRPADTPRAPGPIALPEGRERAHGPPCREASPRHVRGPGGGPPAPGR